jgi:hypothetical protein
MITGMKRFILTMTIFVGVMTMTATPVRAEDPIPSYDARLEGYGSNVISSANLLTTWLVLIPLIVGTAGILLFMRAPRSIN